MIRVPNGEDDLIRLGGGHDGVEDGGSLTAVVTSHEQGEDYEHDRRLAAERWGSTLRLFSSRMRI